MGSQLVRESGVSMLEYQRSAVAWNPNLVRVEPLDQQGNSLGWYWFELCDSLPAMGEMDSWIAQGGASW